MSDGGAMENRTSQRNDEAAEEIMAQGIAEMIRIAAEQDWIPVTERLPGKNLMSLVWSNSNGLHLAYLDSFRQWRDADDNHGKKITHWMKLPAPPTNDKPASDGSVRPVAWVAFATDASESRAVCLTRQEAETASRKHGWGVAPLYAVRLTDAERETIEWAVRAMRPECRAVLQGLLERTK